MKTLQVGESYENRLGTSYLIECCESEGEFRFRGVYIDHNGEADYDLFTEQGRSASFGCSDYDLIIPDEPQVQQPVQTEVKPEVPHLGVILAIVQKVPVQYDYMLTGVWHDYEQNTDKSPVDHPEYNWRIKPKPEPKRTVVIGKRTVVAPEVEVPFSNKSYFYWDSAQGCVLDSYWCGTEEDHARFNTGNLFYSENDAENCYEAISDLLLGED